MLLDRIKYIAILLFFLFCLGLSIKFLLEGKLKLGWAGVAVWGVMSVLVTYEIVQRFTKSRFLQSAQTQKSADAKSKFLNLKVHLVRVWTIFAAILIGTASGLFTEKIESRVMPSVSVWLSSFLFTLLFYPFQKRQKDGIANFPEWVIYSVVMGVVSIVFFHLEDWLR